MKFEPDAARVASRALHEGFAKLLRDPRAESLDAIGRLHRVRGIRRAFARFEDGQGRLRMTTRELVTARRAGPGSAPSAPDLENVFVVELEEGANLLVAAAQLTADDRVAYAHPNYLYREAALPLPSVSFLPGDTYLTQDGVSWSEGSWGQSYPDLFGLRNTRTLEGWSSFDLDASGHFGPGETVPGAGIVVAVIDSGLDLGHPDIAANLWTNPGEIPFNGIDDEGNGFVDDVHGWDFVEDDPDPEDGRGHGTHVSGTVAGVVDNAAGVAGLAIGARIMTVRGLNDAGSGSSVDLADAVLYAIAMGAHITNNSWGGTIPNQLVTDAFAAADAAGMLSIAAAGNSNVDAAPFRPAALDTVMAVAALDHADVRASFSNYGRSIEISAPGVDVLSLNANGGDNGIALQVPGQQVDVDYLRIGGTSMASPHVAGVAAVLMSAYPGESADEIRGRLQAGADPVDALPLNAGFEGLLGAGRLNLAASLAALPTPILVLKGVETTNFGSGKVAEIVVEVSNAWQGVTGVTAVLSTSHSEVGIAGDGSAVLGDIGIRESTDNATTPFVVTLSPSLPLGEPVSFELALESAEGHQETLHFELAAKFFEDMTTSAGLLRSSNFPWRIAVQDYDGDGHEDVFFADLLSSFLFRNQGDASFVFDAGAGITSETLDAPLWMDLDVDGDVDLFRASGDIIRGARVFENDGNAFFSDVTVPGGALESVGGIIHAAAVDFDLDGLLDVVGGGAGSMVGSSGTALLRNNGDLSFTDLSAMLPVSQAAGYGQVSTFDYEEDGDQDFLFIGDTTGISLVRNEAGTAFSDATATAFPVAPPPGGAALAIGDFDNDGLLDLFFTALQSVNGSPPNALFRNLGDGSFVDVTSSAGDLATTNIAAVPAGTEFFDFDNDGDLDLYVTRDVTVGIPGLVAASANALFRNEGDGSFDLVNDVAFPEAVKPSGAAAAMVDIDHDGTLDLYAPAGSLFGANAGAMLRNRVGAENRWIKLRLVPSQSNPGAVGARIELLADGKSQLREVRSSALSPDFVHFGLGASSTVDTLVVRWPSGSVTTLHDLPADQERAVFEQALCETGEDDDGDGVCNPLDNCLAVSNGPLDPSYQVDSDEDGFGNACDRDYDQSGTLDARDFLILARSWSKSLGDPGYDPRVDSNGDDTIAALDVLGFGTAWQSRAPPGPSGLACADPTGATAPCTATE